MLATFAMRPPREMYRKFLEAHGRAVELSGMTPELRGDKAQALHVFELQLDKAESELLIAQRENQRVGPGGHADAVRHAAEFRDLRFEGGAFATKDELLRR